MMVSPVQGLVLNRGGVSAAIDELFQMERGRKAENFHRRSEADAANAIGSRWGFSVYRRGADVRAE